MKIVTKTLAELTPAEYRACNSLNMRGSGMMMYSLIDNKNSPRSHAVMAWENDKLMGWALMVPHDDETSWYPTRYQRRKSKYVTQFYVRKANRRQGIGGRLMDAVKKLEPTPLVIPHDRHSADFFASHDVVTEKGRRGLITEAKTRKKRRAA